ncbi:MAG: hypothetical protein AWU57_512 [Marinobacter sp. T13-3]|nr:MAG: hypothetical protein AWU57_512 [Marinobacter sp. T13-3]
MMGNRMSKRPPLYPTDPIEGRHLTELVAEMGREWDDHELRDLDIAMALNIPPNRISHFKRAKSSIEGGSEVEGEDRGDTAESSQIPMVHPHQAILMRLLMRFPEYALLVKRPTNEEVWELIKDMTPKPAVSQRKRAQGTEGEVEKKGFAPLFGRAAVSSYKMLPGEDSSANGETSLPVIRLEMLILNRLADIFREIYQRYAANYMFAMDRKNPLYEPASRGWTVLRERDSLTAWMTEQTLDQFYGEVKTQWEDWFNNVYLETLRREAVSRGKDPEEVIREGNWTAREPVTEEEYRSYPRSCKPITGSKASALSEFRESGNMTSAEFFWVLGMQVKGFYRYRDRGETRIDAATALLVRHFQSWQSDLRYFVPDSPDGAWILSKIQGIDPNFKRSQLAPLFGASKIASYKFSAEDTPCPYFARRLATIFARELERGPEIYWHLRECVEDEVEARGLDLTEFWKDGKWHK